jgi:hypothetical protein
MSSQTEPYVRPKARDVVKVALAWASELDWLDHFRISGRPGGLVSVTVGQFAGEKLIEKSYVFGPDWPDMRLMRDEVWRILNRMETWTRDDAARLLTTVRGS